MQQMSYIRQFLDHLKLTEIKPLLKNGDRKYMSTYRPIALLTSFYKVLEKVIYERLCQHKSQQHIRRTVWLLKKLLNR
jgi:hypothetical protein